MLQINHLTRFLPVATPVAKVTPCWHASVADRRMSEYGNALVEEPVR